MRLWLSGHLTKLILIPVALLCIIVVIDSSQTINKLSDADNAANLAELLNNTSSVVHEMQKERGMSAVYISSNRLKFANMLAGQRLKLNEAIEKFNLYLSTQSFDEVVSPQLDLFTRRLNQLMATRSKIDNQSISVAELLADYSQYIRIHINLTSIAAQNIQDRTTSQQFGTLFNITNIKENADIERAVLSTAFGQGEISSELFAHFITLVSNQDTFLYNAKQLADPKFTDTLDQFSKSSNTIAVNDYRKLVSDSNITLSADSERWFSIATQRIDLLRSNEIFFLSQLVAGAREIYSTTLTTLILESIVLLVTLFLAYVITRTLSVRAKQTAEISQVMKAIVNDKDLTIEAEIYSRGQLGDIGKSLNQLIHSIKTDFIAFEGAAQEISSATQQTIVVTEESSINLSNMRGNVNQLTAVFSELNGHINDDIGTISQSEEMSDTVSIDATSAANSVKEAVIGINDMANEIKLVGDAIQTLKARVNDITGMVEVIRSVADQTNLLALNAAIEAARAGEHGRGFAVVADEVRTLAQRTQESTEEISRIVDELIDSSGVAFSTIERGNEQAKNSVVMIDDINDVLTNIVTKMHQLNSLSQMITSSSNQQLQQVGGISDGFRSIDQSAEANAVASTQISSAAVRLFHLSMEMLNKLNVYKTN